MHCTALRLLVTRPRPARAIFAEGCGQVRRCRAVAVALSLSRLVRMLYGLFCVGHQVGGANAIRSWATTDAAKSRQSPRSRFS
jgi:hypothetical protein